MAFYENGKYAVRITGYTSGESEKKGTPFFRIYFTVIERVHGDGSTDAISQQYEREATLYLVESCDWSVEKTFEALNSAVSLDPRWLVDTEHEAYCIGERSDDGKTHERWSFYQPGGGKRQDVQELSDKERRTEEAKLRQRLGIKEPVPTTVEVQSEAEGIPDDDCPF